MLNENNTYTNDKQVKFSYDIFIEISLLKLGFNYSSIGTIYFKRILEITYINKYKEINLFYLYKIIATEFSTTDNNVKENIKSTFKRIDINRCNQHFIKVFNIPFEYFYITPKNLIVLFLNTLNRVYK